MCLAIYKPAETKPDWRAYENGYDNNPDSWGFAAAVDGVLRCGFGLGTFAEFREAFEPYSTAPAIVHYRWATHGNKDIPNCHPFWVDDERTVAMIHNGIIDISCDLNKAMSDTWHFNELILKPLHDNDPEFYKRAHIALQMEVLHRGSKFAFLRADGDAMIWNKDAGVDEADGHWYSNTGYLSSRRVWGFGSSAYSGTTISRVPSHSAYDEDDDCSLWNAGFSRRDRDEYEKWWHKECEQDGACENGSEVIVVGGPDEDDLVQDEIDLPTARDLLREQLYNRSTLPVEAMDAIEQAFGLDGLEALYDLL